MTCMWRKAGSGTGDVVALKGVTTIRNEPYLALNARALRAHVRMGWRSHDSGAGRWCVHSLRILRSFLVFTLLLFAQAFSSAKFPVATSSRCIALSRNFTCHFFKLQPETIYFRRRAIPVLPGCGKVIHEILTILWWLMWDVLTQFDNPALALLLSDVLFRQYLEVTQLL